MYYPPVSYILCPIQYIAKFRGIYAPKHVFILMNFLVSVAEISKVTQTCILSYQAHYSFNFFIFVNVFFLLDIILCFEVESLFSISGPEIMAYCVIW